MLFFLKQSFEVAFYHFCSVWDCWMKCLLLGDPEEGSEKQVEAGVMF